MSLVIMGGMSRWSESMNAMTTELTKKTGKYLISRLKFTMMMSDVDGDLNDGRRTRGPGRPHTHHDHGGCWRS